MKFSIALITTLLTSALALPNKRQNDIPSCEDGDTGDTNGGPYQTGTQCEDDCYMTEQAGDRVGQICKGYCQATPLWTGGNVYTCNQSN